MSDRTRVDVYRPVNEDALCITVIRYDLDAKVSYVMSGDGKWVEFEEYAVVPPTVKIPGIVMHELRRSGGVDAELDELMDGVVKCLDIDRHYEVEL